MSIHHIHVSVDSPCQFMTLAITHISGSLHKSRIKYSGNIMIKDMRGTIITSPLPVCDGPTTMMYLVDSLPSGLSPALLTHLLLHRTSSEKLRLQLITNIRYLSRVRDNEKSARYLNMTTELTKKEIETLRAMNQCKSIKHLADRQCEPVKTTYSRLHSIRMKLNVKSIAQLISGVGSLY